MRNTGLSKSKNMKIGVIFSGSGVYDGTEIQEGVFTLLSIKKAGADAVCFAPDIDQHHVVNHITGEEMSEKVTASEQLENRDSARLIMDFFHRLVIHHVFWFPFLIEPPYWTGASSTLVTEN